VPGAIVFVLESPLSHFPSILTVPCRKETWRASIHLAAEQLRHSSDAGLAATGNSRIGHRPLRRQDGEGRFCLGKHWCFSSTYSGFACTSCCGDVRRDGERPIGDRRLPRTEPPRLVLRFGQGEITFWSALSGSSKDLTRIHYDFTATSCAATGTRRRRSKKSARPPGRNLRRTPGSAIFPAWVHHQE